MIYFEYDQTLLNRMAEEKPLGVLGVTIICAILSAIAIWIYFSKQELPNDAQVSFPTTNQPD